SLALGVSVLPLLHKLLDRLIKQQVKPYAENEEIEQMQQDLLPIDVERHIRSLKHEDDENGDDERVDDGGLDEDETEHHARTHIVLRLGLTRDAFAGLRDGDAHAD